SESNKDGVMYDVYGGVCLGVSRNSRHIKGRLSATLLAPVDVVLLEARPAFVTRQKYSRDFLVINELDEERPDHSRAWLSWGILGGIILLAASGLTSMLTASLLGAGAMILSRCVSVAEAKRSLDLTLLINTASMPSLGAAVQ